MTKILKSSTTVFLSLVLLLAFTVSVRAITATPGSGTYEPSEALNISLTANPPAGDQVGVTVHLDASNLTITGYTAPTGDGWSALTIPCAGTEGYTATELCISLVKTTGFIDAGDSLGTLAVTFGTEGSATLTAGANAEYEEDITGDTTPITGTPATFTVAEAAGDGGDTGGELPNTAPGDSLLTQGGLLILGFSAIGIGLLIKVLLKVLNLDQFIEIDERR